MRTRWWAKVSSGAGLSHDGGLVSDLPIRYTLFPKTESNERFAHSRRSVIMASYTFEQDATIVAARSLERSIQLAA